jgi:hypothetical protein
VFSAMLLTQLAQIANSCAGFLISVKSASEPLFMNTSEFLSVHTILGICRGG